MARSQGAVVRHVDGREEPLGEWLVGLLKASGQSVTDTVDRAHLSRSFFYLLKDGKQVPSVESLVNLLEAIPVDEVRLAAPTEPGDLFVVFHGEPFWVMLRYSGRRSVRSRSAWQSLNLSSESLLPSDEAVQQMATQPRLDAIDASQSRSRVREARSYSIENGTATESRATDERSRLLGDLLSHAADLDAARLRLLIAHADLLRDER